MNEKTVFVRTSSGEDEVRSRTAHLSKDIKRALLMVDGTATVAEIMRRASPSLRSMLGDMFNELARGGFIQDKAKVSRSPALVTPIKKPIDVEVDELDFTAAFHIPTQAMLDAEAARVARVEAEQAAARQQALAERARQDALHEKEARLAEQARLDAVKAAEQEKARLDVVKAAEQEKARLEAEVAQLKAQAEAEARARLDAEKRARQVAEAARLENERLAQEAAARIKAEKAAAEAARHETERLAREAAERIRAEKAAAEAARHEAERLAREAEERIRAEKAAAEAARHEAERLAREAEERIRAEKAAAETARHEAERLAQEAEERIRAEKAAADAARHEAERLVQEAARIKAEREAAEALVRAEDERHARESAEAKSRAEQHAAQVRAEAAAHATAVAQEKARLEAEVAKLKALAEAETQARIEATAQARREAEAARALAEQEAAAAREQAEQEAARVKAEHDAALARAEDAASAAAQLAEQISGEAVRAEAARLLQEQNQALEARRAQEAARPRDPSQWVAREESGEDRRKTAAAVQGCDSRGGNNGVPIVERRTTTAAVVFYDIVGYTKQPDSRQLELKHQFSELLTASLDALEASERIILDTGDGAAIGFLQHPTDALESAIHFRELLTENGLLDALRVRIGIHLGPVSLVKDMNGQINMLGDGINSAQRVMSFAGQNQIYVSRAYFEFVSNLGNEYNDSFRYRGAQQDKHGREHQVYELLGAEQPVAVPAASETVLADFNFDAFDAALSAPEESISPESSQAADQLLQDAVGLIAEPAPVAEPEPEEPAAEPEPAPEPEKPAAPVAVTPVDEPSYTEAEARELADAQAEKWEAAKQRAAEARRAPIFEQPVAEPEPVAAVVRPPRKPLPWGKIGAALFALLLAALFVVPALLPMQAYQAAVEQMLSEKLQQPVHIGHMQGRILPTPHLLFADVSIGDAKQIKVKQAQVNFSFAALTSQVKPVTSLELDGVELGALSQTSSWLQQIAGDRRYPVSRILLSQGKLDADGIAIADVAGELDFDAAGKLSSGRLSALAHKFEVEIHATPEQKLQLAFSLRDSALPSLPNWVFEDLKATGELGAEELRITDLDARILGGALNGEARINWRAGWRVQGALMARVIPLQNINKLLSGDLDGSARFQAQSASLAKLADAVMLNGTFSVKKGMVSGVDVIETARLHSRESLPGGRTHFDELSGELFYANDIYQFRPLKLSDSVVRVAGALTVNRKQLSGNVIADLAVRGGSVGLQVGGTTDSPTLSAPR